MDEALLDEVFACAYRDGITDTVYTQLEKLFSVAPRAVRSRARARITDGHITHTHVAALLYTTRPHLEPRVCSFLDTPADIVAPTDLTDLTVELYRGAAATLDDDELVAISYDLAAPLGVAAQRRVIRSITNTELLDRLAVAGGHDTRMGVALNYNTTQETLTKLLAHTTRTSTPPTQRTALFLTTLAHLKWDSEQIAQLAHTTAADLRLTEAQQPSADFTERVAAVALRHRNTADELIVELTGGDLTDTLRDALLARSERNQYTWRRLCATGTVAVAELRASTYHSHDTIPADLRDALIDTVMSRRARDGVHPDWAALDTPTRIDVAVAVAQNGGATLGDHEVRTRSLQILEWAGDTDDDGDTQRAVQLCCVALTTLCDAGLIDTAVELASTHPVFERPHIASSYQQQLVNTGPYTDELDELLVFNGRNIVRHIVARRCSPELLDTLYRNDEYRFDVAYIVSGQMGPADEYAERIIDDHGDLIAGEDPELCYTPSTVTTLAWFNDETFGPPEPHDLGARLAYHARQEPARDRLVELGGGGSRYREQLRGHSSSVFGTASALRDAHASGDIEVARATLRNVEHDNIVAMWVAEHADQYRIPGAAKLEIMTAAAAHPPEHRPVRTLADLHGPSDLPYQLDDDACAIDGDTVELDGDTHTICVVRTRRRLNMVADQLNNCVGGFHNGIEAGRTVVYTVNDPRGQAKLCVSANSVGGDRWEVDEINSANNDGCANPEPIISAFARHGIPADNART